MKNTLRNSNFIVLIVTLIFLAPLQKLTANNTINQTIPNITSFNKFDFDGTNKSWSITFGDNGYTYFGNDIGLLEFDGVSWNLYPSHNGFVVRSVKSFDNRIYSGGYKELGFWERNNLGILEYTSLTPQVEEQLSLNEEFWDISVLNGKVFFRSFNGIYIYTPDIGFDIIKVNGFISRSCTLDKDYLIAISQKGIFRLNEDEFLPFLETDFFKDKVITLFEKLDTSETYLIVTESQGIFTYNMKTNTAQPWITDRSDLFTGNKIDKAIKRNNGDIILGTILNGIIVIDKEGHKKHHINVESGLQSNTVHALDLDQQGNIVVASDKGIDFISFPGNQTYTAFYHNDIGAVYSAALFKDYLYLGTNQGLFYRPWKEKNKSFNLVPGTQRQVWDCTVIDDNLFIGHNSGTFLIDKNQNASRISSQDGASSITQVPNTSNHLIQSTYNNIVLYERKNGEWTVSNPIAGFNDLIQSVEFDHRKNLWASHPYRGIYMIRLNAQLDSAEYFNYHGKNSHLWNAGYNIRVFKVDNRIVFTNGNLIYTYDDLTDSIVSYQNLNDKLGQYSSSWLIAEGFSNHYWFLNKTGIALFKINGNNVEKIKEFPVLLFQEDLIPGYESLTPIDEKTAILCLENGYALLDATVPDAGNRITQQKLILRKALMKNDAGDNRLLDPTSEKIILPFSHNNLSLFYSFPFYSGEKVMYQYIIEGLTGEWSEYLSTPSLTINRIPPGNYLVKIRAINNWQKSSDINEISLTVKYPFYRSGVAFLIYGILILLSFYLLYYAVKRKLKLREQHRWEEKEQELIRQKNKDLLNDLSFKSQQLALSALSMARKNETLLEIKEKLTLQKEQLGTRYPEKFFKEVTKKIEQGITGNDEWKVFENNFKQAHETFLHDLKESYPELTPNDLRLCAFLRINLASKEIAPLLGISVRGVENHRYRLRKKLNLAAEDDLTEFLFTFPNEQKPDSGN